MGQSGGTYLVAVRNVHGPKEGVKKKKEAKSTLASCLGPHIQGYRQRVLSVHLLSLSHIDIDGS